MKKMIRRSRKYINHGDIPTKEYKCSAGYPASGPLVSAEEPSDFEEEVIENRTLSKLPVKMRLMQKFRRNRINRTQSSETPLGWKNRRK